MNDLLNFIETAPCKTMSEAARKLGITQPALSESIKRLETDLNEILFYRAKTGVSLTPTGRQMFERGKEVKKAVEGFQPSINDGGNIFPIRVGCHSVVANYTLPMALKNLERTIPDYQIEFHHDLSRNIQTKVQQGLIDVGIVINAIMSPDLIVKKVAQDSVHIWSSEKSHSNKIFCDLDLFQTQSVLRKWKDRPADIINTGSLELVTRLTEQGLGYGIIPERVVKLIGAKLKKHITLPNCKDEIYIVHKMEFGKNEREKNFLQSLRGALE